MALRPPFYVVADTHFYHRNIVHYANRPYDHESMMVRRWERAVRESDTVLHLGDLFFGGQTGYDRFLDEISPRLTGRKYLILGNHDGREWDYEALGFTVIKPFTCVYRNHKVTFDHFPKFVADTDMRHLHVHGHIHTNGYSHGQPTRWANVNVSVEVINYRPHRITRLLNREITRRNRKRRYVNSRHVRYHRRDRQKRRP